jgi:hypothetical protein
MEIPPSSSFAQSTALFSGLSRDDVTKSILSIGPEPERNSHLYSNNVIVAASMTGELQDFKYDDYREAYRMMNGPPKYPFQSIAQISNSKFDPYYFDGSENDPNFNVNENLIGTPLGTSLLEDPRLSYVKNIMTLKEYQGQADQLNDSYLKELYMVNSEKGSNYYINMLERQQQALEYWSREGRASKNKTIPGIAFTYNLPAGVTQRPQKKQKVNQTIYSETANVQRNYRREVMNRLPSDPRDTVNTLSRTPTADPNVITLGSNIIPKAQESFQTSGQIGNGINMTPVNVTSTSPSFSVQNIYSMKPWGINTPPKVSFPNRPSSPTNRTPGDSQKTSRFPIKSSPGSAKSVKDRIQRFKNLKKEVDVGNIFISKTRSMKPINQPIETNP